MHARVRVCHSRTVHCCRRGRNSGLTLTCRHVPVARSGKAKYAKLLHGFVSSNPSTGSPVILFHTALWLKVEGCLASDRWVSG